MKAYHWRRLIKGLLPPLLTEWLRYRRGIRFVGNYATWRQAVEDSSGYDEAHILQAVKKASLQVIRGEAAFERDSVAFPEPDYPWPLIAVLLRAASETDGRLHVLDFGGALGSTWFQCRDFLQSMHEITWSVVEQQHYVRCGSMIHARDRVLSFHESVEDVPKVCGSPNFVLISSTLQYLEHPRMVLEELAATGCRYLVVDRTPYVSEGRTRLSVQKVPDSIYPASYPVWLFSKPEIIGYLSADFELVAQFDAVDGRIGWGANRANFLGLVFRRREGAAQGAGVQWRYHDD